MKKQILIIPLLFVTLSAWCQTAELITVIPPSPTSREFDKYINYEVSLYNGIPEISIPLYSIQVGNTSIPVTLSYHASGIKFGQGNGEVGVGWVLNPGYRISRTINGRPDEVYEKPVIPEPLPYGSQARDTFLSKFISMGSAIDPDIPSSSEYFDGEFDLFTYSTPSESGEFVIEDRQQNKIRQISHSNLSTTFNRLTDNSIDYFDLKDGGGMNYRFGRSLVTNDRVYDNNQVYSSTPITPSSWMLTDITDFLGNYARFNYSKYRETDYIGHKQSYLIHQGGDAPLLSAEPYEPSYTFADPTPSAGFDYEINRINNITTKEQSLLFYRHGTEGVLDSIVINTTEGSRLKKIIFFYSTNSPHFFLDSVSIAGQNNSSPQIYKFDYYNKISFGLGQDFLPDYWGYYKDLGDEKFFPDFGYISYYDKSGSGVWRLAPAFWLNASMSDRNSIDIEPPVWFTLKKIIYPTGGSTEYEYESNKYRGYREDTHDVGDKLVGLRIKKIISNDNVTGETLINEYRYGQNESGYGEVRFDLAINPYFKKENLFLRRDGTHSTAWAYVETTYQTFISDEIGNGVFMASPVYYSHVTQYQQKNRNGTGGIAATNGKTEYDFSSGNESYLVRFSNGNDFYSVDHAGAVLQVQRNCPFYVAEYSPWNKPSLINKSVFTSANNQYQLIYKENFSYSDTNRTILKGLKVRRFARTDGYSSLIDYYSIGINSLFDYGTYEISCANKILTNKVATTYAGSQAIQQETKFYYNSDFQLSKEETQSSDGSVVTTKYSYPADYGVITGSDDVSQGIQKLQDSHVLNSVVEKVTERQTGNSAKLINATFHVYRTDKPLADKMMIAESSIPIVDFPASYNNSGVVTFDNRYQSRLRFDNYDPSGNVTEQQKANDFKQSYIWDYNNTYPIAEVVNAPVADIAHTSFEADGKGNWTYSGIPVAYPYAHTGKKVYNLSSGNIYKPINSTLTYIISYWRPASASVLSVPGTLTGYPIGGRTVNGWKYYEHKISGQSIAIIMGKGSIDELRLYPADAQMTTYTYEPLIGVTSRSDANNRVTYYEYDGLGRLSVVRDQDKNILKRICYNYAGQPEDCNNAPAPGTIPLAPGNLTAVGFSRSAIRVTWANNATNATGIELYRSYNGNTDYGLLDYLSPGTYSYNDTALQPSTLCYYKVRAVGEKGSSGYSNEASARTLGIVPNILPIENIYMRFNSTVVLPIEATASSPIYITLQVDNLPGFAVFQQTGNGKGTITFTPSQSEQGVYSGIKITAANPQNDINITQFSLTVNSNYVPVIDSISDVTMNEKDSIQVQLSAADQDSSDVLMWSYAGFPAFATVASTNRTAKLIFKPSYGQAGVYRIKAYVNDHRNGKDTSAFTLTVIHVDNPDPDNGTIPIGPEDLAGQFIDSMDAVKLTWTNAAYNADKNEVYRSTYMTGGYSLLNPGDTTNKDSTSYIDNTVAGNATYYYLVRAVNDSGGANSLFVKVTTSSKKPMIHDIDDIYIKRDSSKNVNISATDDSTDIITLLFYNLPGFASFTGNGNGSGVLSLSAVNVVSGVYPITISAIDNYGAFSQKRINIIVTEEGTRHFYINFNNKDYPVSHPLWNSFNATQTGGTQVAANTALSNLKDETGTASAISVKLLNSWPQNYLGMVTGNNSGVFPDAVIATGYFFSVQASIPQKTIRVAGLNANKQYDLTFYGNRSVSTNQFTNYTIGAQTVTLNSRNNTSNTVQITGLAANGQGEIDIVVDGVMDKYAIINAMVIKEYPGN